MGESSRNTRAAACQSHRLVQVFWNDLPRVHSLSSTPRPGNRTEPLPFTRMFRGLLALGACCLISTSSARADVTVQVAPQTTWGTWEGWGASLCWWANVFGTRDDLADLLFTTRIVTFNGRNLPGLGLNIARYAADNWGIRFQSVEPFNEPSSDWWTATGRQEGCHIRSLQVSGGRRTRACLDDVHRDRPQVRPDRYSGGQQPQRDHHPWRQHDPDPRNRQRPAQRSAPAHLGVGFERSGRAPVVLGQRSQCVSPSIPQSLGWRRCLADSDQPTHAAGTTSHRHDAHAWGGITILSVGHTLTHSQSSSSGRFVRHPCRGVTRPQNPAPPGIYRARTPPGARSTVLVLFISRRGQGNPLLSQDGPARTIGSRARK
jgi:hypothetical protein